MTQSTFRLRLTAAAILAAFVLLGAVHASNPVPPLNDPVVDRANILRPAQRSELSAWLRGLSEQTGVQIAILTIPGLAGESLEAYSMRVAEQWKLGQADKDNGALLLVSMEDRQVRIEVGYGLEDKLTDIQSGLIIRNVIIPQFRKGNYTAGITEGVKAMAGIATENADIIPASMESQGTATDSGGAGVGVVFFIIFLMIINKATGRRGLSLFDMLFLAGLASRTGRRSGGSFKSGGSGFGGGSSFGGGGGGFGGGGASGRW